MTSTRLSSLLLNSHRPNLSASCRSTLKGSFLMWSQGDSFNVVQHYTAQLRSLCAGAVLASGHPISVFAPARAVPFFRRGESRLQCTRKGVSRMLPLDATVLIS